METVTKYRAADGKEFDAPEVCRAYETALQLQKEVAAAEKEAGMFAGDNWEGLTAEIRHSTIVDILCTRPAQLAALLMSYAKAKAVVPKGEEVPG